MTRKAVIIAAAIALGAVLFLAGRYSRPAKIVERRIDNSWMDARATHSQHQTTTGRTVIIRKVITERKPTGEMKRTESTIAGADLHITDSTEATQEERSIKIQEREKTIESRPNGALQLNYCGSSCVGGELQLRVWGPLWVGGGLTYDKGQIKEHVTGRIEVNF